MQTLIIILMLIASPVFAMNKCVIDGKTVYTQHPCPEGTAKEIKGSFSVNSTSGIRQNIAVDNERKAVAAQKAAEQSAKQAQENQDKKLLNTLQHINANSTAAAIRR